MSFAVILAFLNKYKKWFIYLGIGILVLFLVFGIKSCFTKEANISEEQIQKVNSQNEKERKEELRKIIEENDDVIKTVDERTTISDANIEERNRVIEEKLEEADKRVQEAKFHDGNVSQEELKCLLIPENCQ